MEQLKFRLRDRHNKIVGYEKWYVGSWQADNPDEGFSLDSGYWAASPCWLYSTDGERWAPNYITHRYKDSYTGLLDKQGKEIYEGDIAYDKEFGNTWKIVWDIEYACFGLDLIKSKHEEFPNLNICTVIGYEVIGNIYEGNNKQKGEG